ncbi:MAG TPA: polysaccharide deacetylase family protein [Terriglobia bacterium]|nr:polysaccharide deacetylase family protein [Terriglobia bacterium]
MELLIFVLITGVALLSIYCYAWSIPTLQFFGPALIRGQVTEPQIALTFDDGPTSPYTEQVLEILKNRKVPATFFLCGTNVERFPQIVRRIHSEGHAIGNHTFSHPFPYFRGRKKFAEEIDRTQEAIERVTGQRPSIFRPPYGARWIGLYPVLRQRGLRLVNWSDTGYDWLPKSDIVRETLKALGPGSIILLHDSRNTDPPEKVDRSRTVQALPTLIDAAHKAGFTFVPLTRFMS